MQSSISSDLGATVLAVCPNCGRPNFLCLNWCFNCGCLLVGNDISSNSDFLPPYFVPQNFRQFNYTASYSSCDPDKDQHLLIHSNQPSLLSSGQAIPLRQKSTSYISMKNIPSSLDVSEGHIPLMSHLQNSANESKGNASHPISSIPSSKPVFPAKFLRHLRQRCISGPCDSVQNCNRNFQNRLWEDKSTCSSFSSDSHISETVRLNCPYFFNVGSEFFIPCQSTNALPVYCHNAQSISQSISQLSELFMGCSTVSQASTDSSRQQPSSYPVNHQSLDTINFNKRLNQNRREVCGFRNKGLNKRNARNYSDRTVYRYFQQPRHVDSVPLGRRRKSRQRSLGSITQTSTVNDANNAFRNAMRQESTVPNFFDPSSAGVSSLNGLASCEDGTASDLRWLRLPTELWHTIVRLLPYADRASLARTCRKFNVIVADHYNWRIIRLDRYQHLTDSGLAMIGRKKPRQLHFTYCRGDAVTNWGIDQLFKGCGEGLESFSFVGCSKGAFQGDYPLLASTLRCPNLCHIDASYAHTVRDQTVRAIAEGSVALKTLLLNGAQHISNSAIEHLVRHHKHTLERLELFGCFHLNSKIFTTLGECHGLCALAFGFLHHLSSNGLLELISKLPLLASLDLRGTQKLVTDTILSRLAKECPLLEEVVLANMSSLTREEGVITMLHQLPRLRVLDLCGLAVVGDNSLQALATSCPLLEELDISCTSVTETGLLCLANAPAASLRSLRISFCPRITANAIEKLVVSCPKLTHLSLYGFSWIKKWDFLFDQRPNLVIQTETQCIKPTTK
ncbi:leucine rich repeats containing F box [Echinococcus multilocularis]|uniref:Leucine rich repeats containing F box n=1 Tax=Echinococcus multilocularis TaxID=6211 RepID=A0A068Y922_ECHMU|nr:leucine rich repeats containing F box [Echinococcus multilocularis]